MCSRSVVGPPGVTLGCTVVTQVLHEVCVGWEGCPGVVCVVVASAGVNLEDEGLKLPRQVMTATV